MCDCPFETPRSKTLNFSNSSQLGQTPRARERGREMDAIRKQLDVLMGANRNGDVKEVNRKYYDRDICRLFLSGLCPHELFQLTKMDMGPCPKVHSLQLRKEYEEAKAKGGVDNYDRDLEDVIDKLIVECDRKISRALKRLSDEDAKAAIAISVSEVTQVPEVIELSKQIKQKLKEADQFDLEGNTDLKIRVLEEVEELRTKRADKQSMLLLDAFNMDRASLPQPLPNPPPLAPLPVLAPDARTQEMINEKLKKAEDLGEQGLIDEAQKALEEAEALKKLAPRQEPVLDSAKYTAADVRITDQKLRVCDICGAFLSVYDNDRRLADHFGGKLHLGYMQIREKLAELQEERNMRRKDREDRRSKDRRSHEREHSKERDGGGSPLRRRDYDRSRDYDRHHDRDRGYDREHREQGRDRERSPMMRRDSRSHRISSSRSVERPRDYDRHRLYFTKIQIGNPSRIYYVQVDTGSDIFWVNCAGCYKCPKKSDIGIKLTLYDPKGSSTAKMVTCDENLCTMIYSSTLSGCKSDMLCYYEVTYGDGSSTAGFFVEDYIHYDRITGNLQTTMGNGSIVFGCSAKQAGQLSSSGEALDGIIGFGQANSSMLSQLAAAGKVKKMFAHCLDGLKGGGIFAIGEVVQPKLNTTPLIPHQNHYNVVMKSIEVAGDVIGLSTDGRTSGGHSAAIIDSGTTLAYLPDGVYELLMSAIISQQPGLKLHTVEDQFKCFQYSGNIDDGFPTVKFHFEKALTLTIYPHEYLFQIREDMWCIGWQNSGLQSKDGKGVTLLGDLVLSNKLVLYDLENQAIGWTEYNCSSSIKVKDKESNAVYTVNAQDISTASSLISVRIMTFLFVLITAMIITCH